MNDPLAILQARIGHVFRDPGLLALAVTHPSYLQDHPEAGDNNQRLELLGDAVLQLILTEALFALYPADREGALSKRRAILTRGGFLSSLAREIGLDHALHLGASEEQTGGRERDSALEDAFEALVGAVHLDAGIDASRRVVLALYGSLEARLAPAAVQDNPKGRLQEKIQPLHGNAALRYETVHAAGEDHAREYEARVFLFDRLLGAGRGTSKKTAEEQAARAALETLG